MEPLQHKHLFVYTDLGCSCQNLMRINTCNNTYVGICTLSNHKKLDMFLLEENSILECFHEIATHTVAHGTRMYTLHSQSPKHYTSCYTQNVIFIHLFFCVQLIFECTRVYVYIYISLPSGVSNYYCVPVCMYVPDLIIIIVYCVVTRMYS